LGKAGPRPVAVGAWLTPRHYISPPRTILTNMVVLGQKVQALLRCSWKIWPILVPPFKVIQSRRNRQESTRHLWLPINFPQPWAYLVPFPR